MTRMKKILFRSSLLLVILAVFVYYIAKNLGTLESTLAVTLSQSFGYIFAALVLAILAFIFMAAMNRRIFAMMGVKRTILEMAILQTSSLAVNVLVPSSGVSVAVLFASDARKRGESEAAAVTAVILALLADYVSIAGLMIFAVVYLNATHSLGPQVSIPAVAFFALTLGMYLLIYYSGRNKEAVEVFLKRARGLVNKMLAPFKKKIIKDEAVIDNFANELENAYLVMSRDKKDFAKAVSLIFIAHFMYLATLFVLFLSLGFDPLYRVLISGYAIGMMFVVISPTPNGVGFVETSMALAYTSLGLPGAAAATVTLIYRGFSFWLPLFIGFLALQRRHLLEFFEKDKK